VDSPTNYGSDTGVGGNVRGNYCTLNPLGGTTNTIRDGNLELSGTAAGNTQRIGTIGVSSGKWYYETTLTTLPASMDPLIGFSETNNASLFSQYTGQSVSSYAIYHISSNTYLQKVNGGSFTNTNTTVASQGDIIGVAIDLDGGKIWFSKNGTWVDNGNPSTGLNAQFTGLSGTFAPAMRGTGGVTTTTLTANFGQRPFAYTAPSGFKALCTQNLPQPTIQKPSKAMDVVTYTGTGASRTVGGLGFSPDLVWFKIRQAGSHALFDIVRGANNILSSNTTGSELTSFTDELTSFTSDGFTLGSSANTFTNNNGSTYVGWSWDAGSTNSTNTSGSITSTVRANPQAGFSIVSYTGNGTAGATVGHGLGVAPKMIIAKFRSTTSDWPVYHSSIANAQNGGLNLNKTDAFTTTSGLWNNTSPTSSVFTVGSGLVTNLSTIIAYCFAEIEGYSKFGSYTGNGSADGPFVWCGFRPRWVMVKRIDAIAGWWMYDSARNDFNVIDKYLGAHNSSAEASAVFADFTSNGIKIRNNTTGENASGGTYIFAAFAESPFKYARAR
jgi:hypothetical protein